MNEEIDNSFIDIQEQNNEKVKTLFLKVGINSVDRDNRTLLHNASCYNNIQLLDWAIENGIKIDHKDNGGRSALHFAVQENNFEIVKSLLNQDSISIDSEDDNGNTALWRGVMDNSDFKIIELLIKKGANPTKENSHQVSPKDLISDNDENSMKVSKLILSISEK